MHTQFLGNLARRLPRGGIFYHHGTMGRRRKKWRRFLLSDHPETKGPFYCGSLSLFNHKLRVVAIKLLGILPAVRCVWAKSDASLSLSLPDSIWLIVPSLFLRGVAALRASIFLHAHLHSVSASLLINLSYVQFLITCEVSKTDARPKLLLLPKRKRVVSPILLFISMC